MTSSSEMPPNTAAALRQAFDRSFAEEPRAGTDAFDDWLAIRLRNDPHVLRLADIARLLPLRALTRYPSAAREWLGLAGVAGAVVPVYDLGMLLGYPAGAQPRWMVLCKVMPVALAFDVFDGQFRHPRDAAARPADAARSEVLRTPDRVRPVVAIASILETIRSQTQRGLPAKEH